MWVALGAILRARPMKFLTFMVAALLSAQQRPDIRVDVDLVTVACSVTDHTGVPARDLKAEDFSLRDNGQPREIRSFWQETDLPLTIALIADVSGSQAGFIGSHREAIAQFLKQVIGPHDRAMIVEVARQALLISDLTGSLENLSATVQKIGTREGKQVSLLAILPSADSETDWNIVRFRDSFICREEATSARQS